MLFMIFFASFFHKPIISLIFSLHATRMILDQFHNFLSNIVNRQIDEQPTKLKTLTPSAEVNVINSVTST